MHSEKNKDRAPGGGGKVHLARMVAMHIAGDVPRHLGLLTDHSRLKKPSSGRVSVNAQTTDL